jgi:lysophospholipid acyltransferase (LPLAT)-like uncharacterized protein
MITFKDKIKINLLAFLVGKGLYLYDKTWKIKLINYKPDISPAIYAVWHGLQYTFMAIPNRENISILISKSNDGEFISRAILQRGFSVIRGSHGRGGAEAVRKILKETKKGRCIAYSVDGPRGPLYKVKEGVIKVAQMSKIPIIPVASDISPCLNINSWDKYQAALIFCKCATVFGEPIYVDRNATPEEMEQCRLKVENDLFALREKACEELKNWGKREKP